MRGGSYKSFQQQYNYVGRILAGAYSESLKKWLIKAIMHLDALDQFGAPVIPYIAAWRPDDNYIWYEYCGKAFHDLLGPKTAELAHAFRDQIVSRYYYRQQTNPSSIVKITRDRQQLDRMRLNLRRMALRRGETRAVYKVTLDGKPTWLKDLATLEVFAEDNIVLSTGSLIDVSSEMQLEAELEEAHHELNAHKESLELLVEQRTQELHKSQLDVISRLTQAMMCRDDETGSHGKRLSDYCTIIAEAYGLTPGAQWALHQAVPMHDVGKVGIADAILLKKGGLSEKEFDIIKTHCQVGADLLDGSESRLLEVARVVALTHHERWDGSGYPFGLLGSEIPLAGRITAICDVFDALTFPRCYKDPWSFEEASSEIIRQREVHFDPELVDLFVDNLPKIERVFQKEQLHHFTIS